MTIILRLAHTCWAFPIFLVIGACAMVPPQQYLNVQPFSLRQVHLTDGHFKHAQDKDIEYLLQLDSDRLLAPYLREAKLQPKANSYGNWESSGLDGHIGGHYLTALSLAFAATGNEEIQRRLGYMLAELKRVQDKNGNGYIGGVPGGDKLWLEIKNGEIDADLFGLNHYWVPWYNIHKMFAGLRDAYLQTDNKLAQKMFLNMCDWALDLTANLTDSQIQTMLHTEHGGMNEVFADAYAISGQAKYLALAQKFSQQSILQPLVQQRDELNGLHANTQIPKVIGMARIAQLTGDELLAQGSEYFWNNVVRERSVVIGGNSVREHFHPKNDFTPMMQDIEGPETCNTYNMIKLSQLLYAGTVNTKYVDYIERALYNHILPSQHPETGGLVYFTPMRAQHYRVYSTVDQSMWCCVGSGIENHVKYGEFIYAHSENDVYINMWVPSTLSWREKGIEIEQITDFPRIASTSIVINKDAKFTVQLRYPDWVNESGFGVSVNGKSIKVKVSKTGQYVAIKRAWRAGDRIDVTLPTSVIAEPLPDGKNYYALRYGPIALAAASNPNPHENLQFFADDSRMGHVASGKQCPLIEAPRFISETPDFDKKIKRVAGNELVFELPQSLRYSGSEKLTLQPFYQLHETRYTLYFPYGTEQQFEQEKQAIAAADTERLALDASTIDSVSPGEQQPESDHFFKSENSVAGVYRDRHWRHAEGWFSYQLNDPESEAKILQVTYNGLDKGRAFDIEINGQILATVMSTGEQGDRFFTVDYDLKNIERKRGKTLELKFVAHPGSIAGGVFGVRLLRSP